jgi:hypothetical protein
MNVKGLIATATGGCQRDVADESDWGGPVWTDALPGGIAETGANESLTGGRPGSTRTRVAHPNAMIEIHDILIGQPDATGGPSRVRCSQTRHAYA